MKYLITVSILLSLLLCNCVQKNETPPIDNEYFLIGTLSDYMGREKYKQVEKRVDRYYQSEKKLCMSIDSIFRTSYPDLSLISKKDTITLKDEFNLYSESLAHSIEKFYDYAPSSRRLYSGDADFLTSNFDSLTKIKDFYTDYFDTIYTGKLKTNIFETELQKFSFITGAYIRFGGHSDSIYHISVANSVSKVRALDELLKEIGCSNVEYKIEKNNIPVGHTVFFKPTDELKTYFKEYQNLR